MTTDNQREEQLANEHLDPDDFVLLNSIRSLYDESDPVPAGLIERIQFELTLDALEAEVATLTRMDFADAGVRNVTEEAVRTITFTCESLTTMVTVTPQPNGTVRVDGWAAPGAGVRVEVILTDGPRETTADSDGRFVFQALPCGLAKFAWHLPRGSGFATVLSPTIEL